MPIELNRLRGRKQVAWLGSQPPTEAKRVFLEREYKVIGCANQELEKPEFLAGLSAVVFTQNLEKLRRIASDVEQHAQRLLNHGCLIILRYSAPEALTFLTDVIDRLEIPAVWFSYPLEWRKLWQNAQNDDVPPPYAGYFDETVSWTTVANFISDRLPVGAPNGALKITIDDDVDDNGLRRKLELDTESEILLRRAFSEQECTSVHLVPIDGGKSGAKVYRAYAERGGLEGLWPQPHFVKIGPRGKIFTEYEIYEERVDPYIPFHLGPHLDRDRCCLGAKNGIIVGDYVEESESLHTCACTGRSASAIACLFDKTLLGWHRQAQKVPSSLADVLRPRFPRMGKFPANRIARARELGATLNPDELFALFMRCTLPLVLVGSIHGDLHAGNVRVRATDAIVIDFYAHSTGPLVYDAACLEASLLVEGFADDDRDTCEWLQSLDPLYEAPVLACGVMQSNPRNRSFWFHACVNQIRRYARQWECGCGQDQYAGALAVALLNKASKDWCAFQPEADRRAAAYVLAERVLTKTFGSHAKVGTLATTT
jgi:hypothetical protein